MNQKTLLILVGAALVLGAAALLMNRAGSSTSEDSTLPVALLPDLKDKVNDIAEIDIKRPGETFSIRRTGAEWGLSSKNDYPVKIEQVKSAVVGLASLKPIEAKTANPALYHKIGVQDPGDKPAETPPPDPASQEAPPTQPTLVTLKDDKGATVASVIIGTQKWGSTPAVFVRKEGDKQSWLAETGGTSQLQVPTDPMQWIERQVLNIPRDRIQSVSVVHPADGSEVDVSREKPTLSTFTVNDLPAGRELTAPTAPESLVTGVQYLSVDDVSPADKIGYSQPDAVAVYKTFDGLVITAQTLKKDNKSWVNFSFSYSTPPATPATAEPSKDTGDKPAATPEGKDQTQPPKPPEPPKGQKSPEEVQKEVADLNAKLSKWAFALPDYKAKTFTTKMEDLLKPVAPPAAPATPAGPSAAPGTRENPIPIGPPPAPKGAH